MTTEQIQKILTAAKKTAIQAGVIGALLLWGVNFPTTAVVLILTSGLFAYNLSKEENEDVETTEETN